MSGELLRRATANAVDRQVYRGVARVATETRIEQATIRSISSVAEFSLSEVEHLKRLQNTIEHSTPDAAEAVAAIVNSAVIAIARRVSRFGNEV